MVYAAWFAGGLFLGYVVGYIWAKCDPYEE